MNRTPVYPVSTEEPRVKLYVNWGYPKPIGEIRLYMKRIGDNADFAYYTPIEENAGELIFEFDNLLFSREPGRYLGRLEIGSLLLGTLQFSYLNESTLLSASCHV